MSQGEVLEIMNKFEGICYLPVVHKHSSSEYANTFKSVKKLIAQGFLVKINSPIDKKKKILILTNLGKKNGNR